MSREDQRRNLRLERQEIIKELEVFYKTRFDRLSKLAVGEGDIAKFTQMLLNSREGAISPLQDEIERPLITKAPLQS